MKFPSQFLDPELKALVDSVTNDNLIEVKGKLTEAMSSGTKFKQAGKHITTINSAASAKRLQNIYYSFILAADDMRVMK